MSLAKTAKRRLEDMALLAAELEQARIQLAEAIKERNENAEHAFAQTFRLNAEVDHWIDEYKSVKQELAEERAATAKRWDYPSAVEETTVESIARWLDAHDAVGPDRLSNIARQIREGKWKVEP